MDLETAIGQVIRGAPSRHATSYLFNRCWRISCAYLVRKVKMQRLEPDFFGLTLDDLALDCIADLFARDDSGTLIDLQAYFVSVDWKTLDEDDLDIALRRIVFSKVNEGLFRRYREIDPSLGRIIRNIKLAVGRSANARLQSVENVAWIVVGRPAANALSAPLAPPALLEVALASTSGATGSSASSIEALVNFLDDQPWYAPGFPLTAFARILRTAMARLEDGPEFHEEVDDFRTETIRQAVTRAALEVQLDKEAAYVAKGKMSLTTYGLYCDVVRETLLGEFVGGSAAAESLYDALVLRLPSVSYRDYRRHHRNVLEYLTKAARRRVVAFFRDDHRMALSAGRSV